MSDVRLTATNPDDSSVVPVACNDRGELLVSKTIIDTIDNDVTLDGVLTVPIFKAAWPGRYSIQQGDDLFQVFDSKANNNLFEVKRTQWGGRRILDDGTVKGRAQFCTNNQALTVYNGEDTKVWQLWYSGEVTTPNVFIMTEADNPSHYSSVRNSETGEDSKEYKGPMLNVLDELVFLRAQIRSLMEKLKMTPDGGWEVWDGESAS